MRTYIVALALALLVPSLSLGAVVAWQAVGAYRDAFETRMQDTARALALVVDREIGAYESAMAAVSGSSALDGTAPDLVRFEVEARRAAAALGTSIILLDANSMRQLINTVLPPGERPNRVSAADFRRAAETGRTQVSDLVIGAVAQRSVVGVAVPVERGDRVPYVLAARLEPSHLSTLLEAQGLEGGAFVVIVDGRGNVVARSRDHERFVGQPAPDWFLNGTTRGQEGFLAGAALEGPEVVLAYAPLESASGWTVAIAEPLADYAGSWRRPLQALAIGGILLIGLGALLALTFARHLLRPVVSLAEDARAFAEAKSDDAIPLPKANPSNVREFEDLRNGFANAGTALRARAEATRQADKRQALLMREVDHRAKNALAVVLSLVRIAPRNVPPEQFAASVEGRVAAMARAHSILAQGGWSGADLRAVAELELAPYAGRATFAGPRAPLPADAVQPLSMLLHELATNAAKHGAFSVSGGGVSLSWKYDAASERIHLLWAETGGPPLDGPPASDGFGTRMINALGGQLGGPPAFDWRAAGLRVSLSLPARQPSEADPPETASGEGVPAKPDHLKTPMDLPSASVAPTSRPTPRVLVVEDEALLSAELETSLRALGCEVVGPVRTLAEALHLAATETELHAAILDVNLGGQDRSFPVAQLLEARGVPFVFATGYAGAEWFAGHERGAVAVLHKPYGRDRLREAISMALKSWPSSPRCWRDGT